MISETENNLKQLFFDYFNKGNFFLEENTYFQALLYFAKALTLGEILNDPRLISKAKFELANVQFASNNLNDAYTLYSELADNQESLGEHEIIQVLNRMGVINVRTGRYQDAKDIFEKLVVNNNSEAKRKAYTNMGIMYYYLDTFFEEECMDKAIQSFSQAYEYCKDEPLIQHRILRNIGMALYEMKKYSKALQKFNESLLVIDNKVELAHTLNESAKVYIELDDFDQAFRNLREAEKILLNKNYRNLEELSRNIYIHGLLSRKQGRIESAFSQFRTALQGFVELEIYPEAALVCREIYETFKDRNNERADFYMDQYQFFLNYLDPMVS